MSSPVIDWEVLKEWRCQVMSAAGPQPMTRLVLIAVAEFMQPQHGFECWVSCATLAECCGCDPRTVSDHLERAVAAGWLTRAPLSLGGRGKTEGRYAYLPATPNVKNGSPLEATAAGGVHVEPDAEASAVAERTLDERLEWAGEIARKHMANPAMLDSGLALDLRVRFVRDAITRGDARRAAVLVSELEQELHDAALQTLEHHGPNDRASADTPPDLMTRAEAAEFLRLSVATLVAWAVRRRGGPRYVKLGRRVLYRRAELEKFVERRTITIGSAEDSA